MGDRPDQGRLAGIGQPEQAYIGDHLHFQLEQPFLTRQAGPELAWRPVGAGLEAGVAPAALAAAGDQQFVTDLGQVAQLFAGVGIADDGADGQGYV